MSKLKVNLRNRCVVLKALATIGPTDSEELSLFIGNSLTIEQVRRALYTLLEADEIFKLDKCKRKGSFGRPAFIYEVKDLDEPRQPKKTAFKKGRHSYTQTLRRTPKGKINTALSQILFRDRKIRLLKKWVKTLDGPAKDLGYGILADFGCNYEKAKVID